jgi:hypothetical protein
MKNNNAKLAALAEAIKGLNSDQMASQLRRVEQAPMEKSQYLRQEGMMVPGVFEKGEACFVPIASSTFYDKGLANIIGIGMNKNGTHVPKKMLQYIKWYEDTFYAPHMNSLKPGEAHYEYAGPVDVEKCIKRGTQIGEAYGLRPDQIEALKNAFLGLDRSYKVYKYYRVVDAQSLLEEAKLSNEDIEAMF